MGASSYPIPVLPSSRTVIVTGGNTGIGYETAKAIARMGARVIIACRSEERAKEVPTLPTLFHYYIVKISVTSPIVINMPTRELLAGETNNSFV